MGQPLVLCAFSLLTLLPSAAQVLPTSSGSCSVTASGLMSCEWLSTPTVMFPNADTTKTPKVSDKGVFVTRFALSPGALLRRTIENHDVLLIGMSDGELVNEAKKPETHIDIRNGSVMLMPKEESYLLRNVGKQNLDLLVIDNKK